MCIYINIMYKSIFKKTLLLCHHLEKDLILGLSKLKAESMESFSLGEEQSGRAAACESCCYKSVLQLLVLPALPIAPLRAAAECVASDARGHLPLPGQAFS